MQLAQDQVSLIHSNPLLTVGYGGEDIPEAFLLVWGQEQRHIDGFYCPPQDNLVGGTGAVPYLQILQRQDLLSVSYVHRFYGLEHLVKYIEQGAPDMATPMGGPLR